MDRHKFISKVYEAFFEIQEARWRHTPYQHELRQQRSIREGDIEGYKSTWHEKRVGTAGKLASDDLRSVKDIVVILISLAARSAINGGISPELSFALADANIRYVEDYIDNTDDAITVAYEVGLEYAKMVNRLGNSGKYNPLITQAKGYIARHMHYKISVATMAAELHVNANYLSTLFSEVENKTITEYIIEQKLYLCENMLKYSDYSIQDISAYFAFSSQSHFTKLFKQSKGITPNEYRKKYMFAETDDNDI